MTVRQQLPSDIANQDLLASVEDKNGISGLSQDASVVTANVADQLRREAHGLPEKCFPVIGGIQGLCSRIPIFHPALARITALGPVQVNPTTGEFNLNVVFHFAEPVAGEVNFNAFPVARTGILS